MKKNQALEKGIHGIFLLLGLITVGCVLLITVYLVISGMSPVSWAISAKKRPDWFF